MSALQQPILMVCAMCGRDQFERPGLWTTDSSSVYPNPVHLCEADAANFDPAVRYDPIAMERYSGVSSCCECAHRHYVMEAGSTVFICARCGAAAPPLLVEVRHDVTAHACSSGLSQARSTA
jgi:ribosomal protein L37AE/L43A